MSGILGSHVGFASRTWWLDHGVRIGVVVVTALVVLLAARIAVGRMQGRIERAGTKQEGRHLQRASTLTHALSYVIRIAVWTIAVLLVLGEFAVDIGPLIAGAGIAGVALGFGAQSLVRDFLSGFFILLEDQFSVGDVVDISAAGGSVAGRIEIVSLRTTWIRDEQGTLHVVPNGNIQLVGNRSRGGQPPPS